VPKITKETGVKIAEQLPGFEEGDVITIKEVEILTTAVQGFKGIRVSGTDAAGIEKAEMLWIRPVVGSKSKLGSFIAELGDDTDNWVGKKIKIKRWRSRWREIEVLAD